MKKTNAALGRVLTFGLVLLGFAAIAPSARAQMDSSAPIAVRTQKGKAVWLKAEVIRADDHTLTVREAGNEMAVHTFTYGPKAAQQMGRAIAAGGYQHGDVIKIQYQAGQTVALSIKGKPSRPI